MYFLFLLALKYFKKNETNWNILRSQHYLRLDKTRHSKFHRHPLNSIPEKSICCCRRTRATHCRCAVHKDRRSVWQTGDGRQSQKSWQHLRQSNSRRAVAHFLYKIWILRQIFREITVILKIHEFPFKEEFLPKICSIRSAVSVEFRLVTDGRTHGYGIYRASTASGGKKSASVSLWTDIMTQIKMQHLLTKVHSMVILLIHI